MAPRLRGGLAQRQEDNKGRSGPSRRVTTRSVVIRGPPPFENSDASPQQVSTNSAGRSAPSRRVATRSGVNREPPPFENSDASSQQVTTNLSGTPPGKSKNMFDDWDEDFCIEMDKVVISQTAERVNKGKGLDGSKRGVDMMASLADNNVTRESVMEQRDHNIHTQEDSLGTTIGQTTEAYAVGTNEFDGLDKLPDSTLLPGSPDSKDVRKSKTGQMKT